MIKRRLRIAIIITGLTFILEIVGGYLTNSLALTSDAVHVFMDIFALSISLVAIYLSEMPPTEKRTYGWHRFEVFASFINGFLLVFASLVICYEAYLRVLDPPAVKGLGLLVIAVAGLITNLAVAIWLRKCSKDDLNVKSAFFHVVGDTLASVGVIASGVLIHFTGLFILDPVISFVITLVILYGAVKILIQSSHILLEGAPDNIDLSCVVRDIESTDGVCGVHSLHVWCICSNSYAFSAHIDTKAGTRTSRQEILHAINDLLAHKYNIHYTTLQMECLGCVGEELLRRIEHRGAGHHIH